MRRRRSKRASCLLHVYLHKHHNINHTRSSPLLCPVSSIAVISAISLVYSTRVIRASFTDKLYGINRSHCTLVSLVEF